MKNCHCPIPENCHRGKHQRRVTDQCRQQLLYLLRVHQIPSQPYDNNVSKHNYANSYLEIPYFVLQAQYCNKILKYTILQSNF